MLWSVGIRHGDISDNNLMWDPKTQKPKLCDFDLSHLCERPKLGPKEVGPSGPTGFSNTGTWIFMATELLSHDAMDGRVKRVYRHEVEAFIAVLVWIICRYQDGKLRGGDPLGHWIQTSYLECSAKRRRTFIQIVEGTFQQPAGVPDDIWLSLGLTLWKSLRLSTDAIEAQRGEVVYKRFVALNPEFTIDRKSPDDYNTLRVVPKILTWRLFRNEAAQKFIGLVDESILRPLGLKLEVSRPSG